MSLQVLAALVAVTLVLVLLARGLARHRGRDPFAWGLATAVFPPSLLLLALLPKGQDATRDAVPH